MAWYQQKNRIFSARTSYGPTCFWITNLDRNLFVAFSLPKRNGN